MSLRKVRQTTGCGAGAVRVPGLVVPWPAADPGSAGDVASGEHEADRDDESEADAERSGAPGADIYRPETFILAVGILAVIGAVVVGHVMGDRAWVAGGIRGVSLAAHGGIVAERSQAGGA